jgi:nucleotide-binding universal stress UspA family protein
MLPEINKILYATDLSDNAKYAFGYAVQLAKQCDATISILYVMENMNYTIEVQVKELMGNEKWEKLKSDNQDSIKDTIKTRIEDFCKEMDSKFDSCRLLVEDILITQGNPTEKILTVSKEINSDMIILGTHGHNILVDSLIGGTTRRVVKQSQIPVMVIRLPEK